jgi:hypothetical protein
LIDDLGVLWWNTGCGVVTGVGMTVTFNLRPATFAQQID